MTSPCRTLTQTGVRDGHALTTGYGNDPRRISVDAVALRAACNTHSFKEMMCASASVPLG